MQILEHERRAAARGTRPRADPRTRGASDRPSASRRGARRGAGRLPRRRTGRRRARRGTRRRAARPPPRRGARRARGASRAARRAARRRGCRPRDGAPARSCRTASPRVIGSPRPIQISTRAVARADAAQDLVAEPRLADAGGAVTSTARAPAPRRTRSKHADEPPELALAPDARRRLAEQRARRVVRLALAGELERTPPSPADLEARVEQARGHLVEPDRRVAPAASRLRRALDHLADGPARAHDAAPGRERDRRRARELADRERDSARLRRRDRSRRARPRASRRPSRRRAARSSRRAPRRRRAASRSESSLRRRPSPPTSRAAGQTPAPPPRSLRRGPR